MGAGRGVALVYAAAAAWSTIAVATRLGYAAGCTPSCLLVARQLFAAAATLAGAALGVYSWRVVVDRRVFLLGAALDAPFYAAFYYGVLLLGVAREEVLLYTAPLWVLLYESVAEARRPGAWAVAASLMVVAGAAAIGAEEAAGGGLLGYAVGLLSGALYGATIYAAARLVAGLEPASVAAGSQLWLLVGAVPLAVALGGVSSLRPGAACIPAALYLALAISHASYVAFYKGLGSGVSAHRASVAATLELVLAVTWGVLLFHEPVTPGLVAGAALVAAAQVASSRSARGTPASL